MNRLISKSINILQHEGAASFARKSVRYLHRKSRKTVFSMPGVSQFCYQQSKRRLQSQMAAEDSFESVYDTVESYRGYGIYRSIKPMQDREEIIPFLRRVQELQPRTVLEIGTANGGTLYLWCRALSSTETILSLDLGFYPAEKGKLFHDFAQEKDIHLYRRNSQRTETQQLINQKLDEKEIDLLFIDGDHSYEGVKRDFELYKPLVADGGVIAFHDIIERPNPRMGVPQFWDELTSQYQTEEFCFNGVNGEKGGKGGIGLLYK